MPVPTIGDALRERYPQKAFKSIRVEITEYCKDCHPTKVETWVYGDTNSPDVGENTAIHHGRAAFQTCKFDATYFASIALVAGEAEREGAISAYQTDDGHGVSRKYKVTVVKE